MTLTTGPKIYSCEMRISCLVLADIHVIEDALHLLFGDYRTKGCGTIGRITHPDRLRALRQPVDHLVVNLLVRENGRTRRAYLPGVEEDSGRSGLGRSLDVGVVKDDVGGLAAEFERHAFEVTRRAAQNSASHTRRSGEGDLAHIRMIVESVADDPTRAGDDIQDAWRQARFEGQLTEPQGRQRCQLGGLHHDRAAAGQSRCQLPHADH